MTAKRPTTAAVMHSLADFADEVRQVIDGLEATGERLRQLLDIVTTCAENLGLRTHPDTVLSAVLKIALGACPAATSGSIWRASSVSKRKVLELRHKVDHGAETAAVEFRTFDFGRGLAGRAARLKRLVSMATSKSHYVPHVAVPDTITAMICAPIMNPTDNTTEGVICLHSDAAGASFSEDDSLFLGVLGRIVGTTMRHHHRLRIDDLMKIRNGIALRDDLRREIDARQGGSPPPLNLLWLDIDKMKGLNDKYLWAGVDEAFGEFGPKLARHVQRVAQGSGSGLSRAWG